MQHNYSISIYVLSGLCDSLLNEDTMSDIQLRQCILSLKKVSYTDVAVLFCVYVAKLATGWPMPLNYCRIAPHQCEVHGHSSTSLKLPQWLRRRVFKQVVLCLVGNTVCISKTTEKPIESVVDITKGPFHLNGNKLTAGSLVVTVPQNKIFKWQEVIG